jgi:hypothetical protein
MSAEEYRRKFAEFLALQPGMTDLTAEQITQAQTREELGISSLNMILVLMNYIDKYADGKVAIRPEWVSSLDNVDGITSVLHEIDTASLAPVQD